MPPTQPFPSYTNSSLVTARRCLREFELRYRQRLDLAGDERETLQVGHAWHRAFHVQQTGGDPFGELSRRAPTPLWAEKLRRLFSAYSWRWVNEKLEVTESESTFRLEWNGHTLEGQRDAIVKLSDGRLALIERKTSGEAIDATAAYWDRLRLDTQVGIYALSMKEAPSVILYDVVRKPEIRPKNLTKADVARMRSEIARTGFASYYAESFSGEQLEPALLEGRESIELYGARLTADIGDRPEYYFQRRLVERMRSDFDELELDLEGTINVIETCSRADNYPRNPSACNTFGLCQFFRLCSNNQHPRGDEPPPEGFVRRDLLHPELAPDSDA